MSRESLPSYCFSPCPGAHVWAGWSQVSPPSARRASGLAPQTGRAGEAGPTQSKVLWGTGRRALVLSAWARCPQVTVVAACCLTSQGSCSGSWSRWLVRKDKTVTSLMVTGCFSCHRGVGEAEEMLQRQRVLRVFGRFSGPVLIRVATAVKKTP